MNDPFVGFIFFMREDSDRLRNGFEPYLKTRMCTLKQKAVYILNIGCMNDELIFQFSINAAPNPASKAFMLVLV